MVYFDDRQIIGRIARVEGQTVLPVATVQKDYTGNWESHLTDREDFTATLNAVVAELAQSAPQVPSMLYLGVPAQFCHVETQTSEIEFDHFTKVNRHHLQALWENTHFHDDYGPIIQQRALYYQLAERENVFIDVLGVATNCLTMVASAIAVNKEFCTLIDESAIVRAGFRDFAFLSTAACELFLIPESARDAGCTLVHSDFFSTTVANVLGDGLTHLSHFNLGVGHLVQEVMEGFNVDYDCAAALVQMSTPTYEMLIDDTYHTHGQTVPAGILNGLVLKQLHAYAARLSNLQTARVLYLSGGNFNQIYGVTNLLANDCGRKIYPCCDPLTQRTQFPENTLIAMARYLAAQ